MGLENDETAIVLGEIVGGVRKQIAQILRQASGQEVLVLRFKGPIIPRTAVCLDVLEMVDDRHRSEEQE